MSRTSVYYGSQSGEIAHFEGKGFFSDRMELCTILRGPKATRADGKDYFEAIAFGGKRAKPDWHYTFSTVERREAYIAQYVEGQQAQAKRRAESKATRTISGQAAAAKMIRAELKAKFPGVAFSVTSQSFAGGDSVDVDWTDGPTADSVEAITCKYQYGHFDGMTDCYENSNSRKDIPQAKYVQTQRSMSEAVRSIIYDRLAAEWGVDMSDDRAVMAKTGQWPNVLIHREFWTTAY